MNDTEVRVVNEFGGDVAQDGLEQGEVIVRGHGVMNPDINVSSADGWLHTGDRGTIDENGQIKIIEPKKNLSINDEENISSIEVENIITEHPSVQEAVIISIPHEKMGHILNAFIVLNKGHEITEHDLINFSRKKLNKANCPLTITFMNELPKTRSGKILKVQLAQYI